MLDRAEAIAAGTFDDEEGESEDGEEGEVEGEEVQQCASKKRPRECGV